MDLVFCRAVGPDWRGDLSDLAHWVKDELGVQAKSLALYDRALTHSSHAGPTYERLEFLGDRVLGW